MSRLARLVFFSHYSITELTCTAPIDPPKPRPLSMKFLLIISFSKWTQRLGNVSVLDEHGQLEVPTGGPGDQQSGRLREIRGRRDARPIIMAIIMAKLCIPDDILVVFPCRRPHQPALI